MPVNFCARSRSSAERARRRLRAGEEASGFARGTVEEEERVRGLDAGEVIEFVRLTGVGEAAFEPVALGKSDALGADAVVDFRSTGGELRRGEFGLKVQENESLFTLQRAVRIFLRRCQGGPFTKSSPSTFLTPTSRASFIRGRTWSLARDGGWLGAGHSGTVGCRSNYIPWSCFWERTGDGCPFFHSDKSPRSKPSNE